MFEQFGFEVVSQRGSHVKLRRASPSGDKQVLTVPKHDELDPGTLRAIIRQASRFVSGNDLRPYFWTE